MQQKPAGPTVDQAGPEFIEATTNSVPVSCVHFPVTCCYLAAPYPLRQQLCIYAGELQLPYCTRFYCWLKITRSFYISYPPLEPGSGNLLWMPLVDTFTCMTLYRVVLWHNLIWSTTTKEAWGHQLSWNITVDRMVQLIPDHSHYWCTTQLVVGLRGVMNRRALHCFMAFVRQESTNLHTG